MDTNTFSADVEFHYWRGAAGDRRVYGSVVAAASHDFHPSVTNFIPLLQRRCYMYSGLLVA
jgi:hypothetical protein